MHFSIHKAHIFKALSHVQSVVEKRNTIPILSNILLTATQGKLSLTATDLDIEIVETVDADIHLEGALTVPAHMFYEIVRKLPDTATIDIEFHSDNERITLTSGRSQFTLPTLPKDDYPLMISATEGTEFSILASDLKLLLDKNKFAMSQEETRYYLNGIFVHTVSDGDDIGQMVGVATDGHRLAKCVLTAPHGSVGMPEVIIPRKTVMELRKLIEDVAVDIQVNVTDTKIRFFMDNILLTSKLIDGTFPAYKNVIPSSNKRSVIVNTKSFISAVDRVATISADKVRAVKLSLEPNKIILQVENSDFGSAVDEIEVEYQGDSLEIGFNARYLLDILAQLDTPEAQLFFGEVGTPVIIHNKGDDSALYILMPMRI